MTLPVGGSDILTQNSPAERKAENDEMDCVEEFDAVGTVSPSRRRTSV